MVKILAKNPGMGFDAARKEALTLLGKAAGGRVYRFPKVLSPEEQLAERDRLKAAFRPLQKAA
jgi:hypothetical protein